MTFLRHIGAARIAVLTASLLLIAVPNGNAQQVNLGRFRTPAWAADSVLRWFEREAANPAQGNFGRARVLTLLSQGDSIAESKRDSVADGLERIALTSGVQAARQYAVSYLAAGGSARATRPLPDVAARLARLYHSSRDRTVRTSVLMLSWTVSDRAGMIPLLREAASAAPDLPHAMDDNADPAALAVGALANMGEIGRSVLRQLQRDHAVRSPRAEAQVERLLATPLRH